MTEKRSLEKIDFDLTQIVRAIEKAIAEDVPRQLSQNHLETNNYIGFIRGDFINDNLRNFALEDGYELIPIHRYGWCGRIILNREKKVTLSIITQANLRNIPHKPRSRPHYTMSILNVQNGDLEGKYRQETIFPMELFDDQELQNDYDDIIAGAFDPSEGYHHYFVAYQAEKDDLTDVKLILMDPNFCTVEEYSLNHLIKPDFSRLTEVVLQNGEPAETEKQSHREATRKLTRLKPALRKIADEA